MPTVSLVSADQPSDPGQTGSKPLLPALPVLRTEPEPSPASLPLTTWYPFLGPLELWGPPGPSQPVTPPPGVCPSHCQELPSTLDAPRCRAPVHRVAPFIFRRSFLWGSLFHSSSRS